MNVIITGASGLVATELTLSLLSSGCPIELTLVSRNPYELANRYQQYASKIKVITIDDLIKSDLGVYDVCVHTAFARSSSGDKIVESLDYTNRLCKWVKDQGISKFVNLSSQSVYGNCYEPFIKEDAPCNPGYMYALAKYSSELLIKNIFEYSNTQLINIRLSSICENARFVKVFVSNAIHGRPLELVAPNQVVSFIDIRDVASAISKVILAPKFIPGDYNLGSGQIYNILNVAKLVNQIGTQKYNLPEIEINIDDNGTNTKIGMSIEKICSTYDWKPIYNISDMITSLFELLINVNGGGIRTHLS